MTFVMLIASLLAYLGHDTVAGIFGTTTIVGLVTIFVIIIFIFVENRQADPAIKSLLWENIHYKS